MAQNQVVDGTVVAKVAPTKAKGRRKAKALTDVQLAKQLTQANATEARRAVQTIARETVFALDAAFADLCSVPTKAHAQTYIGALESFDAADTLIGKLDAANPSANVRDARQVCLNGQTLPIERWLSEYVADRPTKATVRGNVRKARRAAQSAT